MISQRRLAKILTRLVNRQTQRITTWEDPFSEGYFTALADVANACRTGEK